MSQNDADIVLVVDQTFNDMSVTYGNAGPHEFAAMLEAAMAENPQAEIWVKVHPDVLEGKQVISLICVPRNEYV